MLGLDRTATLPGVTVPIDLVVLDTNSLTDVRNSQRLHAIITRERREQMLADVEAAASRPPSLATAAVPRERTCGCRRP